MEPHHFKTHCHCMVAVCVCSVHGPTAICPMAPGGARQSSPGAAGRIPKERGLCTQLVSKCPLMLTYQTCASPDQSFLDGDVTASRSSGIGRSN